MNHKESGFILISSYILIAGLLTAVFSYFSRSFYDFDLAQRRLGRLQALYTAESGAERAIEGMKGTIPVLQPDCGQSNPSTWTPYSNTNLGTEGTYTVRITNDCTSPNQIYWIRSTGTFDNVTREMRLSVRLTNFANYALASDHMDPDTYFTRGTRTVGPGHINGPVQIYGKLGFSTDEDGNIATYGGALLTSSASEVYYYNNGIASDGYTPTGGEGSWTDNNGREATASQPGWYFEGGRPPLLNQPRILFPPADVSALKQMSGTQVVNQKMWVRFNRDGTYNYSTSGPITETNLGNSRSMPPKGSVMYFEPVSGSSTEPAVVVRGIIDRDLTIASPQNIGIDGNLRYECYTRGADNTTAGSNACTDTDPKLTVVSAQNIVHLPEAELDAKTRYGVEHFFLQRTRILTGAFMALGGGMAVPDAAAVRNSLIADMDIYSRKSARLDIQGTLVEYEMKPRALLLGGYQGRDILYSDRTGFDNINVEADPRLDLSSLPPSMRQAVSILSWEACDGPCA